MNCDSIFLNIPNSTAKINLFSSSSQKLFFFLNKMLVKSHNKNKTLFKGTVKEN